MFSDLLYRLRALFHHGSMEAELDEELRAHFERLVETNIKSGLSPEEARRRARLAFGGLDQVKEECRDARGVSLLENIIRDMRYGLLMLRRNPAFTVTAVLSLAIGIAMNTAVFSLANAIVFGSMPYSKPGELVFIWQTVKTNGIHNLQNPPQMDIEDWEKASTSFEGIGSAAQEVDSGVLMADGPAESAFWQGMSPNLLRILGVQPALGRT